MRIVILTYESHQANLMTQCLIQSYPQGVVGIMASDVIVAGKSTTESLRFLLKKTGWGFVARKGTELILSQIARRGFALLGKRLPIPSLAQLSADYGIPLEKRKNVNSRESRAILADWQPDLIVSIYFNQLIKKRVIALPTKGVINIHPALLPKNRGLFPYFWALRHGDRRTGVTVHWVEPKFDTGDIIAQAELPIRADDTVVSLARASAEIGAGLLVEAVNMIEHDTAPSIEQDASEASYYSWPTAADVRAFRRVGRRYGSLWAMWRDLTR